MRVREKNFDVADKENTEQDRKEKKPIIEAEKNIFHQINGSIVVNKVKKMTKKYEINIPIRTQDMINFNKKGELRAEIKCGWQKYYSIMRPVSIGTYPEDGMIDFINYDTGTEVNGRVVCAEIYYNRELTQKELEEFEMVRG